MARQRLYRLLGETSLELKCLALFGGLSFLVSAASFLSYWLVTEKVVEEQNPNTARLLVERIVVTTHFDAMVIAPNPTEAGFSKVMAKLDESLKKQRYGMRFISPDPAFPRERPRNEYEEQVLARFMDNRDWHSEEGPVTTDNEYQLFQEVRADNCLGMCHAPAVKALAPEAEAPPFGRAAPGEKKWQDGDLMAVVRVTIPNEKMQERIVQSWNILLAVAVLTFFLALIAFYVTIRYLIARPLKHLRDVSDAVSHGNIALRADIHTGDEFESLGVAFNRMLRHLVHTQDELRQVNADLDGKVDELAQVNMQLYEMNRIKSDFLATMSHELRTPLNSILGFSDVLGRRSSRWTTSRNATWRNIQKSGRMLLDMINNILDLAKIESGKMEMRLARSSPSSTSSPRSATWPGR